MKRVSRLICAGFGMAAVCASTSVGHATRDSKPKILKKCTLPLTGVEVVDHIVTELAFIDVTPQGLVLRELAPDVTLEQVQAVTEPQLHLPSGGPAAMPL